MLKRGRSIPFADPALTALDSRHIWLAPAGHLILDAVAVAADRSDKGAVFVPSLSGVKHILVDATGRQHVLVRANGAVLQLDISGADVATTAVALTFQVQGVRALGRAAANFSSLRRIVSERHPQAKEKRCWTVRTRNLRDGFVTFDCLAAGAPDEKEAAILLYGAEKAMAFWPSAHFRERMRRNRHRAQELVGGEYRKFLK